MRRRQRLPWILVAVAVAGAMVTTFASHSVQADSQRAAGALTVFNRTSAAFEQPAARLTPAELERHGISDLLFERSHVPEAGHEGAGLGPRFNAHSCVACHVRNGRGRSLPGESLVRVALQDSGGVEPLPDLGHQIQDQAVFGYQPEATVQIQRRDESQPGGEPPLQRLQVNLTRPNGVALDETTVARSLRIAPPLIGLGLLEAIPEQELLRYADPDDRNGDGISGRPVWMEDENGTRHMGRFGWKAGSPTILAQSADAYLHDMGLTTPAVAEAEHAADGTPADIGWDELNHVTFYSQSLGAPATGQSGNSRLAKQGRQLFSDLNCAGCHVPRHRTSPDAATVVAAMGAQTIWPYTDLLVHDMGPDLDDGVAEEGLTVSSEWRTAPLWGLGLTQRVNGQVGYLHDGRARSVDEAIRWHGGEARDARDRYLALARARRSTLLEWLQQL